MIKYDKEKNLFYYGNHSPYTIEEIEDEIRVCSKLWDCLMEMGVDSPNELTIEQARAVGRIFGLQISDLLTSLGHPDPFRERKWN